MIALLLSVLPWLVVPAYAWIRIRLPRPLPTAPAAGDPDLPLVSVVVPARNEEENIGRCLGSLTSQRYPRYEIVVVDDRSEDRTGAMAREMDPGEAERLEVVEGAPLPDGWFGKPWACWQGAREARGGILLFTDADTVHGPDLLARSVTGLRNDALDALSVAGRQEMKTFWERVVQPQVFALLAFRFPDLRDPVAPGRCRDAAANGQYIMIREDAYRELGGHRRVRGEVVEDLRLAQELCRDGFRLSVRLAEGALSTRMYRSLAGMAEGWTKNLATAARQTLPDWAWPGVPVLALLAGVVLWIVPPLVLGGVLVMGGGGVGEELLRGAGPGGSVVGLPSGGPGAEPSPGGSGANLPPGSVVGPWPVVGLDLLLWSAATTGLGLLFWVPLYRRLGAPVRHALLYPLGTAVVCTFFVRSWVRGERIEWKGRGYGAPNV